MWRTVVLLWLWTAQDSATVDGVSTALRAKRFDQALQDTQILLTKDSHNPRIWTLQGLAHSGLGDQESALADFRNAVRFSPDYLPALQAEAQIEYADNDPACTGTLQHILKLDPRNEVSHAMLGAISYTKHDCPATVTHYAASERTIQSQPAALTQYAECLWKQRETDKAVQIFSRTVALTPLDWQPRYNLASVQLMSGHPQDAVDTLGTLIAEKEVDARVLDLASSAYEGVGNTPRAVELLRQAILLDPANVSFYLHFADLCFAHKSFTVGVDVLNAGLKKSPSAAPLCLARGILSVQLGQMAQAESDFAEAARLDPSQAYSSVALGLTELQQSNLPAALEVVRAKAKQETSNAYLHYLHAEILRQSGAEPGTAEFSEAMEAAQRAIRLQPRFPLALDLLGTFYLRQNKPDLASQQFRKVLAIEPANQSAIYHLILASRKTGATGAVPELMKRLAEAKSRSRKLEEQNEHYTFVEPARK
jgi:tetratricopeptide (TPR) repeat protein